MLAGKRILALPKYSENGASSRLRSLQYIPHIEAAGAQVDVESFFDAAYIERLYAGKRKGFGDAFGPYLRRLRALLGSRRYDMLWVEKELFPYLPGLMEYAPRLASVPYIVDYDDAVFHNYDLHSSGMVRRLLGNKLDALLRGASAVTAGNSYLADYAKSHGAKRVEFLPTVVDLEKYPISAAPENERIRIGWIGTPTTSKYLAGILPQLEQLAARHPLTLVTIGAPPIAVSGTLEIEQHPWSEGSEAGLLGGVNIGIMPLPDEAFERGKCGYKLIQYMACGRPVVASPVGVNQEIVTSDVGLLANEPDDWLEALGALCGDAGKRKAMGAAGRAKVEAGYSLQVTAPRLINLMAEVMAS